MESIIISVIVPVYNAEKYLGRCIDSVLNPSGGFITADSISQLIIEKDKVDPSKTKIICRNE